MTDPTPQTTPTRDEAPEVLAKQVTAAASDMCEIARIAGEWRNGPKQSLTAIREIRAVLASAPAPASGRVDAAQSLHHASGERITRKDLNDAYRKGAEDGWLATRLIDSMFDGPVANEASLSPAATPVSEAEPVYISRSTLRYLLDGMRLASVYVSKHPNMDDPVALYTLSKPAGGDVVRCLATGNPVGTDTWQVDRPCRCANCSPLSQSTSAGRVGE